MQIKIDEDLPRLLAEVLSSRGYDARTVRQQGLQGITDELLWKRVQAENRWLITADKGFADLRLHPPGSHAGLILLRPYEESRRAYVKLTEAALAAIDLADLTGAVVVVTDHGIRVRRPTGT